MHNKKSKGKSNRRISSAEIHSQKLIKVLTIVLNDNCTEYPWSADVLGKLRARDWPGLYLWSERATTVVYSTATEHFAANQIAALILKAPFDYRTFGFEQTPERAAVQKFLSAERTCRKTNHRFTRLKGLNPVYTRQLAFMRDWIRKVIGDEPNMKRIRDSCGFSSGASIGVHGNATNLFRKFHAEDWTVTPSALPYVYGPLCSNEQFLARFSETRAGVSCLDLQQAFQYIESRCRMVTFNKLGFVLKTAKTDRSIAIEPLLNSYIQKGADLELRRLLAEWGYDLSDQSRNAHLAMIGSLYEWLATLDLSSASDCNSIGLCRYLLPRKWFSFLDAIRSPSYQLDGNTYRYEKFVSMGNGFCFPLETLIFAAAVRASMRHVGCQSKTHAVYGDDIIIPTEAYGTLVTLLRICGFIPNEAKSFATGKFRESCGADWYEGQDVRPVYLDFPLASTSARMTFHNATLRSNRVEDFFTGVRDFLRADTPPWERLYRPRDPSRGRIYVDKSDSLLVKNMNGAFDVPYEVFKFGVGVKWNRDEQRWTWREYCYTPVEDTSEHPGFTDIQYLAFLSGSTGGKLNLRRKTRRHIVVR